MYTCKRYEIPCPNCGVTRVLLTSDYEYAKKRLCMKCARRKYNNLLPQNQSLYPHIPGEKHKRINPHEYYVRVRMPNHPRASKVGQVKRCVLVMEASIGRYLLPNEEVHHINKNIKDDRLENLRLMTHGEHAREHARLRREARMLSQRQCEPVLKD